MSLLNTLERNRYTKKNKVLDRGHNKLSNYSGI